MKLITDKYIWAEDVSFDNSVLYYRLEFNIISIFIIYFKRDNTCRWEIQDKSHNSLKKSKYEDIYHSLEKCKVIAFKEAEAFLRSEEREVSKYRKLSNIIEKLV